MPGLFATLPVGSLVCRRNSISICLVLPRCHAVTQSCQPGSVPEGILESRLLRPPFWLRRKSSGDSGNHRSPEEISEVRLSKIDTGTTVPIEISSFRLVSRSLVIEQNSVLIHSATRTLRVIIRIAYNCEHVVYQSVHKHNECSIYSDQTDYCAILRSAFTPLITSSDESPTSTSYTFICIAHVFVQTPSSDREDRVIKVVCRTRTVPTRDSELINSVAQGK